MFIHSDIDRLLGSFHFLSITNKAAMNSHVQGIEWAYRFLLGKYIGAQWLSVCFTF